MRWHSSSGAMSRSTFCALLGLAAGKICKPSEAGTARASLAEQISGVADAEVLPAAQDAQIPEHAEVFRPALLPKVPAGQSKHWGAFAGAKVPGGQNAQTAPDGTLPAEHVTGAAGTDVLPAVQVAQVPEQFSVESPAWSPKVPAGQRTQLRAPEAFE